MPRLAFWYEFASSYSYLAAMRIERLAAEAGVDVDWRPFLLGPIFAKNGWKSSPFNIYPERGRYMWRDMARWCERLDLPLRQPDPFPQNGLRAARIALVAAEKGWIADFTKAVFSAEFGMAADISEFECLAAIVGGLDRPADEVIAHSQDDEIKNRLRAATAEAERLHIFGAPSFVTEDGELFWGNDRLEEALDWAAKRHS